MKLKDMVELLIKSTIKRKNLIKTSNVDYLEGYQQAINDIQEDLHDIYVKEIGKQGLRNRSRDKGRL